MASHLETPSKSVRRQHARGESRGSDYVLDVASGDNLAMAANGSVNLEAPPHFDGYLQYRTSSFPFSSWRTLWFVLEGHYLRSFRNKDQTVPRWSKYLLDCEIKANDRKLTLKIKMPGRRRYYELRARDKDDYQCWRLVLQRSLAWKDMGKRESSMDRSGSTDSLDLEAALGGGNGGEFFADSDLPALTDDMTLEEIVEQRKQAKKTLVGHLTQLQATHDKLDKKKDKSDDVAAFVKAAKNTVAAMASYVFLVENERDQWMQRWEEEHKQFEDLDNSLSILAREHQRLEATLGIQHGRPQSADPARSSSSSSPAAAAAAAAALSDSDESDDETQFYDALERRSSQRRISARPSAATSGDEDDGFHDAQPSVSSPVLAASSSASSTALVPSASSPAPMAQRSGAAAAAALGRAPSQLILSKPTVTLPFQRRECLPADKSKQKASVWAILKHSIGKDLSRIGFPIIFNEPLSGIQRMCEDLEYAEVLDYASTRVSALERLAYVSIFSITNYANVLDRANKPFNPILGETYECIRPDRGDGWKFIGEQVSHHPPVSAMYATSDTGRWQWQEVMHVTNSFRPTELEIHPLGYSHVWLPEYGEHYTWKKMVTVVKNIVIGAMWMDNYGKNTVTNHKTGDYCEVTFKPYSYMNRSYGPVEGVVKDKNGKAHYLIRGYWTEYITIQPADLSEPAKTIWRRAPLPPRAPQQFHMTKFGVTLNEIEPGSTEWMAPTDCRFRPDLRLYEEGKIDEAQKEKERLEEKQRAARRLLEARGESYKPKFFVFEKDPDLGVEVWNYKGGYWEKREKKDWADMPDLYSKDK